MADVCPPIIRGFLFSKSFMPSNDILRFVVFTFTQKLHCYLHLKLWRYSVWVPYEMLRRFNATAKYWMEIGDSSVLTISGPQTLNSIQMGVCGVQEEELRFYLHLNFLFNFWILIFTKCLLLNSLPFFQFEATPVISETHPTPHTTVQPSQSQNAFFWRRNWMGIWNIVYVVKVEVGTPHPMGNLDTGDYTIETL